MSEQVTLDSLEFAASGGRLAGEFALADLARLAGSLASRAGTVRYELVGRIDDEGKPRLSCKVEGTLELVCQRCLDTMFWPIATASDLRLVADEAALAEVDEPEGPELLAAQKDLSVRDLVEDEILLALPIAPKHPEGRCQLAFASGEASTRNPFAVLAHHEPI